jgi:glycosyltransferase involved in cell wall biosynthesis
VRLGIAERVRFLGQRADVADVLAAADIHCQPNTGPEPFGVAFVEALYAGLPVVTTSMGGALEIIDDNCGILVPPGEPHRLASSLFRLLRNAELRARLGQSGRVKAHDLCAPASQLTKMVRTLEQITRSEAIA